MLAELELNTCWDWHPCSSLALLLKFDCPQSTTLHCQMIHQYHHQETHWDHPMEAGEVELVLCLLNDMVEVEKWQHHVWKVSHQVPSEHMTLL